MLIALLCSVLKRSETFRPFFRPFSRKSILWKRSESGLNPVWKYVCWVVCMSFSKLFFFCWKLQALRLFYFQTVFRPFSDRDQKCSQHLPLERFSSVEAWSSLLADSEWGSFFSPQFWMSSSGTGLNTRYRPSYGLAETTTRTTTTTTRTQSRTSVRSHRATNEVDLTLRDSVNQDG